MKKIQFVLLLIFTTLFLACSGLNSQQQLAADEAINALRKIDAATQVGVGLASYNEMLIEAKAEVNEAEKILPDGDLKTDLDLTMFSYEQAAKAWRRYGKAADESGQLDMYWKDAKESLERISATPSDATNKRREALKGVKETLKGSGLF